MADAVRWGDVLYLSGGLPSTPRPFGLRAGGFESQAAAVLDDVGTVLAASGSGFEHVLRVECYLADAATSAPGTRVFREHFPTSPPARTTLVTGFAVEGLLIELQVTAGVPS